MLEVAGLAKTYDGFEFGPVDLSVDGEVLAVLGPSGSGKTTLLSTIAGLVAPDAGSISLDGRELVGTPPETRRTGLVFQDGALFPHMSAAENVAYAADPDRAEEVAELLEIGDVLDRRPRNLSGGERQRVALARTLAAEPDALLLDEPLSSLDAPIRRRLRDQLHDLFASLAVPIVYITHDRRAATTLGDRVAVLRDGTVEQVGPPADVLYRPETPFVARFTGTENVFEATVSEHDGGAVLRVGDATLRTRATAPVDAVVTACVHPSRIRVAPGAGDGDDPGRNAFSGTVRRWLNEGDAYRAVLDLDGVAPEVVATVHPGAVDGPAVAPGTSLRVTIPPDAVHLIPS